MGNILNTLSVVTSIIVIIGTISGVICKISESFMRTRVEKQFETNNERFIRHVVNIFLLFMSLTTAIVLIISQSQSNDSKILKLTVDFLPNEDSYKVSGKLDQNVDKLIYETEDNKEEIEVKKDNSYERIIKNKLPENKKYSIKFEGKEILSGKIPTKKDIILNNSTINFNYRNGFIEVSGKIAGNVKNLIFTVGKGDDIIQKSVSVDSNRNYAEKYFEKLSENKEYQLTGDIDDDTKVVIRSGNIPSMEDIDKEIEQKISKKKNELLLAILKILGLFFLVIIYLYYFACYIIRDNKSKPKLIIKLENKKSQENEEFVILKTIGNDAILLQKRIVNSKDFYDTEEVYRRVSSSSISDKDLEFEKRDDIKRRRYLTAYHRYKDKSKNDRIKQGSLISAILLIMFIILVFLVGLSPGIGFVNSFKVCFGILLILGIVTLISIIHTYSLYIKGEYIIKNESEEYPKLWQYLKQKKKERNTKKVFPKKDNGEKNEL